ncbi:serine hydrolase domain-containing protein [Steroidobacter sp.]|uniref:serine hydrolase domain-containing protein n=1 Tax=Steroidobacter sp. TaxID=1978227 RepID=UPI001A5F5334|nr:serine hydrolase domain-containing protein [Steroidobacter sp.]MBL8270222.1 beta-lactamase family protein [Steroidobacter sp.]
MRLNALTRVAAGWMLAALIAGPMVARADAIDDAVNAALANDRIPGLALAVIQDGVLVRAQGYGYANLEHRVPVHPDTIFQTGSLGKMFTAVAVMLMVEDGKLNLDESIRRYLPEAPASWKNITPRHILTHTSGLSRSYYSYAKLAPGDFDLRQDYSEAELLQFLYRTKLDFPAGQKFSYSNTGYALLGLLVKRVGGVAYADVLKQRVFRPLGMTTAGPIDDRGIVPNRAAGYDVREDGTILNQEWVAATANGTGDGTLYLTVLDWAKWDAAVRARKILQPQSWEQIFAPARLNSGKTYPYGFGWNLANVGGQKVHMHGGQWQGFVTHYVRYEGQGLSVVVLTNSRSGNAGGVAKAVAQIVDPKLAPPSASPIEDRNPRVTARLHQILLESDIPAAQRATMPPDLRERIAGAYQKSRGVLGKLQELKLFSFNEMGDDGHYLYRARFDREIADVILVLSPSGDIQQLALRPVAAWNAPLK